MTQLDMCEVGTARPLQMMSIICTGSQAMIPNVALVSGVFISVLISTNSFGFKCGREEMASALHLTGLGVVPGIEPAVAAAFGFCFV